MKKDDLHLKNYRVFLLVVIFFISFLHLAKQEPLASTQNTEGIAAPVPITMITIIPIGATASFLMGSADDELKTQPHMDHADYYTHFSELLVISCSGVVG